jgi:hypothetical protein
MWVFLASAFAFYQSLSLHEGAHLSSVSVKSTGPETEEASGPVAFVDGEEAQIFKKSSSSVDYTILSAKGNAVGLLFANLARAAETLAVAPHPEALRHHTQELGDGWR